MVTVIPAICPDDAQYIERCVQGVEESTTTRRSAEIGGIKECKALTKKQTSAKMNIILINSINSKSKHSVIKANLKIPSNQAIIVTL